MGLVDFARMGTKRSFHRAFLIGTSDVIREWNVNEFALADLGFPQ